MKTFSETIGCEKHKAINTPCCPICLMKMVVTLKASHITLEAENDGLKKLVRTQEVDYADFKISHGKLMEYAQHKPDCTKLVHMATHTYPSIALDCNCGLEQALKEASEICG